MEREEAARLVEAHGQAVDRPAYAPTARPGGGGGIPPESFFPLGRG